MNGGILLSVFAACYMMVPLYKQFCQATGLVGDDVQKDYSKVAKDGTKRKLSPYHKFISTGSTI
jgi:cytochrome c oxidase assembly protein Cox11